MTNKYTGYKNIENVRGNGQYFCTFDLKDNKKIKTFEINSLSLNFVNEGIEDFIEKNIVNKNKIINIGYFTSGIFKIRYHAVIIYQK